MDRASIATQLPKPVLIRVKKSPEKGGGKYILPTPLPASPLPPDLQLPSNLVCRALSDANWSYKISDTTDKSSSSMKIK